MVGINIIHFSCLSNLNLNFALHADNVIAEEVTEYLEEIMNNEFNTLCEDGSTDEIGESMCRYYQMIKNGNEADVIKELQKFKGCSIQQCKSSSPKEDKDMEDQDSEDINPESTGITHVEKEKPRKSIKNEPDEDGWVTVSKGKKK